MTKKSRPFDSAAGTASSHKFTGNTAAEQRARVLHYLQTNRSISTLEARHVIDVMHPAARVMELRKLGSDIQTVWAHETNPEGYVHRIARYVLMSEVSKVTNTEFRRVDNAKDNE
jgi:hypothetical protein